MSDETSSVALAHGGFSSCYLHRTRFERGRDATPKFDNFRRLHYRFVWQWPLTKVMNYEF
jgi:hypothetical protein